MAMKRVDDPSLVKSEGGPLPLQATLYTTRPALVTPPTAVAASVLQAVRVGSPHSAPTATSTVSNQFPRGLQPLATPTTPALNLSNVPGSNLRPKSPDTAVGMQSSVQTVYPGPVYTGTLPGASAAAAAASPAASNNNSALHNNAANALLLQQAGASPGAGATSASIQSIAHQQHLFHQAVAQQQVRHKVHTAATAPPAASSPTVAGSGHSVGQAPPSSQQSTGGQQQPFPRLKVEDALSYLDQVKYKFGNQPQVYNDFLDIMKEFKSQSIDTPGVIARVSSLFRGHPELIVGFNTFLPLGYKIEVQSNEQDGVVSCQVSVSVPGGMNSHTTTVVHAPTGVHHISQSGVISAPLPGTAPPAVPPSNTHAVSGNTSATPLLTIKQPVGSPGAQYAPGAPPSSASAVSRDTSSPGLLNSSSAAQTAQASSGSNTTALPVHSPASLTSSPALSNSANSQPVEFNHAINYVNKIKNRFQGQPEIYKQFLEILHTYQKEQRSLKEGLLPPGRHLTEAEVYDQVARLFQNQGDLLQEFGQFLPDATSSTSSLNMSVISTSGGGNHRSSAADLSSSVQKKPSHMKTSQNSSSATPPNPVPSLAPSLSSHHNSQNNSHHNLSRFGLKRPLAASPVPSATVPNPKKPRLGGFSSSSSLRDVSLAEAAKYGTLNEYAFFDKVRKALRSQEVYDNFLRCLVLFNQDIVSRSELLQLVMPFLGKFPELLRWFKDFLGCKDNGGGAGSIGGNERGGTHSNNSSTGNNTPSGHTEPIPHTLSKQERVTGDLAMEIDYTTCKRLGASYCALPKSYVQPKCTGRTPLCREVLNDTWVSFPSWSEDSTFVSSRKTQYEEYIYRCEDERYELDVVLETNLATIRVLEGLVKKMARMSPDELNRFRLDDCLGGTSPTIHLRAIRRIYGDRANDIIEGLKKNPSVAVPVVLKRLKTKEEEWREAQKGFNKIWREQNEKYYLKSLDHQGINFKQNDAKALRSKSLLNEIETLFDERQEQNDDSQVTNPGGAHLILPYKDRNVLDDAAELLIHHAKRQAGIHKEDKRRIKTLLRHSLPDMFRHQRQELSEDERDDDDDNHDEEEEEEIPKSKRSNGASKRNSPTNTNATSTAASTPSIESIVNGDSKDKNGEEKNNQSSHSAEDKTNKERWKGGAEDRPPDRKNLDDSCSDEYYTLFYGNNHWYVFLRLHQILCERLAKMYERAVILAAEERKVPNAPSSSLRPRPSLPGSSSSSNSSTAQSASQSKSAAEALRLKQSHDIDVEDYYPAFLDMVKNVLDGHMESSAFEDTLRELFGIHAYLAFTLDKVVINAVRQLQHLVSEEVSLACHELWLNESKRGGGGGYLSGAGQRQGAELVYQKKAEQLLADENLFKIVLFKEDCRLTIQLMDTENGDTENASDVQKWASYVEDYTGGGISKGGVGGKGGSNTRGLLGRDELPDDQEDCEKAVSRAVDLVRMGRKPLMLRRNLRLWRKRGREDGQKDGNESGRAGDKSDPTSDLMGFDSTQCRFNLQSYKMVFVVNSESVLYRRHALSRARASRKGVSQRNHARFAKWHSSWASQNVSAEAQSQCTEWLLGRGDNVVPNRTEAVSWTNLDQPPFVPYTRYKVTRLATPSQTSATVPMETS